MYDLMIIGGGPAGYLAAERASAEGLSTLLIEKRFIGGVCLNEGCIPSKSLLYSAKIFDNAKHGEAYGVHIQNATINHAEVVSRKNKVVKSLVSGIKLTLRKCGVKVLNTEGQILGRISEGFEVQAGEEVYQGKRLLIATGSTPIVPPISGVKEGLENGFIVTNREILDLTELPSILVIIGGGVIGLEMASYFQSVGSKVTVIEMLDHIAGKTDREISEILKNNYQKKGVEFKLGTKVIGVMNGEVQYEVEGKIESIPANKVLLSIGRQAVTQGFGLEKLGVEIEHGHIKTDDHGKTNISEVYAAGDVNGMSMLAHTAYREAEVCINNIMGRRDHVRYGTIPSAIYTTPEVGSVGETEESAKQKGLDFEIKSLSMMFSGRYVAESVDGDGICKILIDKISRKLIGVHMIGNYASEIIYGASQMIEMEMRVEDVKELVFPHPTVSEAIRETIFKF